MSQKMLFYVLHCRKIFEKITRKSGKSRGRNTWNMTIMFWILEKSKQIWKLSKKIWDSTMKMVAKSPKNRKKRCKDEEKEVGLFRGNLLPLCKFSGIFFQIFQKKLWGFFNNFYRFFFQIFSRTKKKLRGCRSNMLIRMIFIFF